MDKHIKRFRLTGLFAFGVVCALILAACGNGPTPEVQPGATPTITPQPTLNLDQIPVLGEGSAPPVPLAANDPQFPIKPANTDSGKALYDQFCAACHGIDGAGEQPDPLAPGAAPPHNADGHTWHHPDQQNFLTVWQGRTVPGVMPGFYKRLTPDEIISILGYIKTWWLPDQLEHQVEQTQRIADQ